MKNLPLLTEVIKYSQEKNLIFSMPGNKSGKAFEFDEYGKEFVRNLGYLDITEVEPLDNLHDPKGVIDEAQKLLAKTYGAKKAYFLVNGSSCGNLSAIFDAFEEGDEILVERNCHKSVYNALILRKLRVRYIEPRINKKFGIPMPPTAGDILDAVDSYNKDAYTLEKTPGSEGGCPNGDNRLTKACPSVVTKTYKPKGIVLTSPSYYGISFDYEDLILELKKRGIITIIDAAHGAHFVASEKLPKSLTSIADYVVLSAHKTLPSLTQGAYLIVNRENTNIEFYINSFMTTSPSYLIMSSLDYSRYYLDTYGKAHYDELINRANFYKAKINKLDNISILDECDIETGYSIDKSRYILILENGFCGHKLLDYLRKNSVQAEMSFDRGVVLILSPINKDEDFKNLLSVLENLDFKAIRDESLMESLSQLTMGKTQTHGLSTAIMDKNQTYGLSQLSLDKIQSRQRIPQKVFEPFEMLGKKSLLVKIEDSCGKISKENIVPYPPGIPLVCAGEVIDKNSIEIIFNYIENRKDVLGTYDGKINVVEDF